MKIKVTQQQRDNLLDALHVMWPSVPGANVVFELGAFRQDGKSTYPDCNTVACFGGWCAAWPAFMAQGIAAQHGGAPRMGNRLGTECAQPLFGDDLFEARGFYRADRGFAGSDHALVTNRLQWLLDNSEVAE